ncbi:angiopoietin-2-like [Eriocheir sinensis]|uniref:angiopoietin-2-like n=1 Tax=Eriocheir sinensis TaxID=95602 RepID=UPI0021C61530|nr:angiopoietin-2-like [Eriocheir sinensis]
MLGAAAEPTHEEEEVLSVTQDEDEDQHLKEEDETAAAAVLTRFTRQAERDPYIFNLFEVLLTTLESKLRRVENMDRALERLVRRLDTVENRLAVNLNTTAQLVRLLETRLVEPSAYRNPGTSNGYVRSSSSSSTSNNNNTSRRTGTQTSTESTNSNPSRSSSGSSSSGSETGSQEEAGYGKGMSLMEQRLYLLAEHVTRIDNKLSSMQKTLDTNSILTPADELVAAASESYRVGVDIPKIQSLDKNPTLNKLQESIDNVRESVASMDRRLQFHMAYVSGDLEQLAGTVRNIHTAILEDQSPVTDTTTPPTSWNVTLPPPRTKIDSLVDRMSPMETVWEKMEEVWDVVVGTKSSVDVLVPKSEALLNTSQRQERAISTIQSDLTEKANRIIQNLDQVEQTLKTMPLDKSRQRDLINPVTLLHRSTHTLHLQDDTPVEDPPGDLADQSFLTEHNSSEMVTTTERPATRSPLGPSGLVFPSVQGKPVTVNNSFIVNDLHELNMKQGFSCVDLLAKGMKESGTYHLKIRGTTYWFLKVYCDMEIAGGGWTVIQRRDDFGEPRETFNREWNDYKHGFGNPEAEFWLGNENIYMLTNTDDHMLRVELEDFDGNRRYAEYSTFKLHSEKDNYKLEIGGYSGNAGDSLNDPWYGSNLSPFSTVNRDNDRSSLNCASMLKGGWWWRSCGRGLNGIYLTDPNDLTARQGIVWFRWRGWDYTLKRSVLMIKPKDKNRKQK